jgi:hypothetical protein
MAMASLPKVVRAGSPAFSFTRWGYEKPQEAAPSTSDARSATPAHKDDGPGFNFKSRPVIFLIFADFLTI